MSTGSLNFSFTLILKLLLLFLSSFAFKEGIFTLFYFTDLHKFSSKYSQSKHRIVYINYKPYVYL